MCRFQGRRRTGPGIQSHCRWSVHGRLMESRGSTVPSRAKRVECGCCTKYNVKIDVLILRSNWRQHERNQISNNLNLQLAGSCGLRLHLRSMATNSLPWAALLLPCLRASLTTVDDVLPVGEQLLCSCRAQYRSLGHTISVGLLRRRCVCSYDTIPQYPLNVDCGWGHTRREISTEAEDWIEDSTDSHSRLAVQPRGEPGPPSVRMAQT